MSVNLVNKTDGSLQKVAGKIANGELIPSVSYYQMGQKTSDITSWSTGETGTFSIDLSEDMPDTDYVVVPTLSVVGVSAIVHSKTVNSFKVTVRNDRTETIALAITLYWQAFKLMTDENRALDETAIAQNTSDISDLQDDKQDKTLETPLTIGGASRTTVEGALRGLNGLVPSGASASNQLIAESDNYPKVFVSSYHGSEAVYKFTVATSTQTHFLINVGYGGDILLGVHTRDDRITAIQLGSQNGSTSSATMPTIKASSNGLTFYVRVGSDAPLSITQLYPAKYSNATVTMESVTSSDSGYTSASIVTIRRVIVNSDLTSLSTSTPSSTDKLVTQSSKYKIQTQAWNSAGNRYMKLSNMFTNSAGLMTTTYLVSSRNGEAYLMMCGNSDGSTKSTPQVIKLQRGTGKLDANGFYWDADTSEIAIMTQGYNIVQVTQIAGERTDFTIGALSTSNPLTTPTALTVTSLVPTSTVTSGSDSLITSGGVASHLAGTPKIGVDTITLGRLGLGDATYNKLNMSVVNCSEIPGTPLGSNGQGLYAIFGVIEFAVGPISFDATSWKPNTVCKVRVNHAGTYGDWTTLT